MPSTSTSSSRAMVVPATVPSSSTLSSSSLFLISSEAAAGAEAGMASTSATPCIIRRATPSSSSASLLATPQNVPSTSASPNLLSSGNDRLMTSNSFHESYSLDDSLHIRLSTPDDFHRNENSGLRRSLNRVFDSVHEDNSVAHSSLLEGSPLRALDSRSFRSDASTPIRKSNKFNNDGSQRTPNASYGSMNKSKSFEKVNSKKSPGASLCLGDFLVAPARHKRRVAKEHIGSENRSSSEPGGKSASTQKPKRRVVPTLISSTTSSFTSPAFRSENNILEIAKDEVQMNKHSGNIEERQALKSQMNEIAKEFTKEAQTLTQVVHTFLEDLPKRRVSKVKINISEVMNKSMLDRFIIIHSTLIDMNLTNNILTELSFLINILNMEIDSYSEPPTIVPHASLDTDNSIDPTLINRNSGNADGGIYSILRNVNNCIYYALGVLRHQRPNLTLLDVTTLKVILENERLELYDKDLQGQLVTVCAHKVRLESIKSNHEASFHIRQDFNNVFYQQENDTKNNFPSEKEFRAFKQQRDVFYDILKTWESKHLSPTWDFSTTLGSKVCSLLVLQDNPINMAHLAKLFISQLIISSNFSHSPSELEMSLPDVDLNKLTKLQQRLVTPSHFSTDYQFPGNQAFFRDFLLACRKSLLFIEQLKIALTAQLIEMNDSSYEILNLSSKDVHGREYNEYVVRPETLVTMRILSKFLGLVETLPYTYDGARNSVVDDRQIELRNMIQPSFDIMAILRKSITERKLIITIPWIVQYISMLDYVTLRLTYYRHVIQLLYELYMNLTTNVQYSMEALHMRPTSTFIIRTSLGWLFDNPNLPEDYYKYRQNRRFLFDCTNFNVKEMANNAIDSVHISKGHLNRDEMDTFTVKASETAQHQQWTASQSLKPSNEISVGEGLFDPLLESILNVACPFLADFRVSIMPTKFSKSLSRTGRYRHITTKISEASSTAQDNARVDDAQTKLSEAFLHSQSLSVRKIVEFVIERTTSAVIKDFQIEILIPSKANAMLEVEKIESVELKQVSNEMHRIFLKIHTKAMQAWDKNIPEMIQNRVKKALDALLPHETLDDIKRTCTALVIQKCKLKIEDWRLSNLENLDFYSKDIMADAEKIIKNSQNSKQSTSTVLEINLREPLPSKLLDRLQFYLYFSITQPIVLKQSEIFEFCESFQRCLSGQVLPTSINKLAGVMTMNLVQNLIQCRCDIVSDKLIDSFINLWKCDALKEFIDISLENADQNSSEQFDNIFNGLVSKFYIKMLGNNLESFHSLTQLLIALVNANLLTIDYLNQRFVRILKLEWPNDINQIISAMLDNIARSTTSNPNNTKEIDKKSQLFMEMLADLTRDLDEF